MPRWPWSTSSGLSGGTVGKRTKARECAVQMLYQWDLTREPMDRVVGLFWQVRSSTEETQARAERLARGAQDVVGALDEAITRVSTNWRFERIAARLRHEIGRAGLEGVMTAKYLPRRRVLRVRMLTSPGFELDYPLRAGLRKALVHQIRELARRGERAAA